MVIAAARELYAGVPILEEDLYAVRMPTDYVPEGAFSSPEQVVGRIPTERILSNELVRFEYLSDPENGHGPSDVVPDGTRVVEVPTHGAVLRSGAYVDVWVTPEGGRPCTVLQAAFVVALEGELVGPDRASARAGLLVLERQALQLGVAARRPSFRLTARQEQDIAFREGDACSS
jgi:Flp pilus assembly protein CpaB